MTVLDRAVSAIPAHALLQRSPFVLIDPARAAAAGHLEQTQTFLWVVAIALQIAVLAWFWRSGQSARLRDALRARVSGEFWARFCFGASLALLDKAVAFVPMAMQYRFLRLMDLSELLFRQWLAGWVAGTLAAMAAAGAIAAAGLWLADRTHQWYLYTMAAILGITLLCAYAAPAFASPAFENAAVTRTLAHDVGALRARTGITAPLVEQAVSARTRVASAYVSGLGSSSRMVLPDTLLASTTAAEMRFVIARLMAWIARGIALQLALVQGALIVVGSALAVAIADRIGFRRDDDPVSRLALLGAIIGLVYVAVLPFYNGYCRRLDLSVDAAALRTVPDRASAIRLEVRYADDALVSACPGPVAQWYLLARPSPAERISALQGVADACVMLRP